MDNFEYREQYRYLTNICLNLTDSCNFACKYCFVEQNPHFMTYDIAQKSVDFIIDNYQKKQELFPHEKHPKPSITYFGGEPTLLWDEIIVPLTQYITANHLPVSLNMTTNGSLLNEDRITFLKNNNIHLLLSMDGNEQTQCFNRPCRDHEKNSFELTSKNISAILAAFPQTTFRATIYAPTVEHTFENYLYAIQQGFQNVYFLPDVRHSWTEEQIEILHKELNKIYCYIDFCFSHNVIPPRFSMIEKMYSEILKRDVKVYCDTFNPSRNINHKVIRCGLGTTLGSIGYDGKIYGCQEQTSQGTESFFYIGDITKNGIDPVEHKRLLAAFNKQQENYCIDKNLCNNCLYQDFCKNINCPSTSYDLYQDFFISPVVSCLYHTWILNNNLILMKKYTKQNNLTFKSYLDNYCGFKSVFKEEEIL